MSEDGQAREDETQILRAPRMGSAPCNPGRDLKVRRYVDFKGNDSLERAKEKQKQMRDRTEAPPPLSVPCAPIFSPVAIASEPVVSICEELSRRSDARRTCRFEM